MKFADLDEDCVFLILENLDLENMLNMAQVNENFSKVAADGFRREYSHSFEAIRSILLWINDKFATCQLKSFIKRRKNANNANVLDKWDALFNSIGWLHNSFLYFYLT